MSQFRNPYHFVPVTDDGAPDAVALEDFAKPQEGRVAPHLTHDRFVKGTHSGRIAFRVTVETPLICANAQDVRSGWTKLLQPFELVEGEPALPGSSLRGMLSTLIEAASQSALRVLSDPPLSFRRPVGEGLSAIGMIVERQRRLFLYPLAEPHRDLSTEQQLPEGDSARYATMFKQPRPKVYIGSQGTISSESFLDRYQSYDHAAPGPFYAIRSATLKEKTKPGPRNRVFWLGEEFAAQYGASIRDQVLLWDELRPDQRESGEWIRGILRVLGRYPSRHAALRNKKHEFFLRYSEEDELRVKQARGIFPIQDLAIERFEQLADQRAKAANDDDSAEELLVPFSPHGMRRERPADSTRPESSWRLKAGDIVFFRPSKDGDAVVEVSLSSVWRGRVEDDRSEPPTAATARAFFPAEKRPLHPERQQLSLAEQLLGVVEVRPSNQQKADKPAFAWASRVRFGHGRLESAPDGGAYLEADEILSAAQRQAKRQLDLQDIPLRNLASPKTPSPSLYFKKRDGSGAYIKKTALKPSDHAPQGIKFYLRRNAGTYSPSREAFVHPERLAAQRDPIRRQHQSVQKFVRPASTFVCNVDFDNLTKIELALLVYALRPTKRFRHQLGHGRPLGLGQVRIEIVGLTEIDRRTRYAEDPLDAPRCHHNWSDSEAGIDDRLEKCRKEFESWASRKGLAAHLRALELLGAPPRDDVPVHYPQVSGIDPTAAAFEQEHYKWFVANDDLTGGRSSGQYLPPLVHPEGRVAHGIPVLERGRLDDPPSVTYVNPAESGVVPPQTLLGRELPARAADRQRDGRVPFVLFVDEEEVVGRNGYVEMTTYERAAFARSYPPGTEVMVRIESYRHGEFFVRVVRDGWEAEVDRG